MKIQIDLKSVALGLLVGIGAMFALGADSSSNQAGHYQVSAASDPNFAVIVDTQTGKAWAWSPIQTSQYRSDANFFDSKDQ